MMKIVNFFLSCDDYESLGGRRENVHDGIHRLYPYVVDTKRKKNVRSLCRDPVCNCVLN